MIFLKISLSLLIVISTTYLGYVYSNSYVKRFENLICLKGALKILETEILYGSTPLPEALMNVYNKSNVKIRDIFKCINEDLITCKRELVISSFLNVKESMYRDYFLKKDEIESFMDLGRVIGSSDRCDQEKNFKLLFTQLDYFIEEARSERDKYEKMYRNLGVLTGLGIIIILL